MDYIGYAKGDKCNRDGCNGIIDAYEKDGCCSCHINPPCSYCETPSEYCPICGWDAQEEQREIDAFNVYYRNKHPITIVEYKPLTFDDLDGSKIDYIRRGLGGSWNEITGKFPNGTTYSDVLKHIGLDKYNCPKLKMWDDINNKFILTYCND